MKNNKEDVFYIVKKVDRNRKKMDEAGMLTIDGIWAYLKKEKKKFR